MIYFEGEHAKILYHEDQRLVEVTWKDAYSNEADYRLILTKALVAIKQYDAENWLSDVRQKKVFLDEERKWLENFIIPNACTNGIKKVAFVLNKNIFQQYKNDEKKRTFDHKEVALRIFDETSNAITWFNYSNN